MNSKSNSDEKPISQSRASQRANENKPRQAASRNNNQVIHDIHRRTHSAIQSRGPSGLAPRHPLSQPQHTAGTAMANPHRQVHGNPQHEPPAPSPTQDFREQAAGPSIFQQPHFGRPETRKLYLNRAHDIGLGHNIPGIGYLNDSLVPPPPWKDGDDLLSPEQAITLHNGTLTILHDEYERAQQQGLSTEEMNLMSSRDERERKRIEVIRNHRIDIWAKYHESKAEYWKGKLREVNFTYIVLPPSGPPQTARPRSSFHTVPQPAVSHPPDRQPQRPYPSQPSPGFQYPSQYSRGSQGSPVHSSDYHPSGPFSPSFSPPPPPHQHLPPRSQSFGQEQHNVHFAAGSSRTSSHRSQNNQRPMVRSQSSFAISPSRDVLSPSRPRVPFYGYPPNPPPHDRYDGMPHPPVGSLTHRDRGVPHPSTSNATPSKIFPAQAARNNGPLPSLQDVVGPAIIGSRRAGQERDSSVEILEVATIAGKKAPPTRRKITKTPRGEGRDHAVVTEDGDEHNDNGGDDGNKEGPDGKSASKKLPASVWFTGMLTGASGKPAKGKKKGRTQHPPIDEKKGLSVDPRILEEIRKKDLVPIIKEGMLSRSSTMPAVTLYSSTSMAAETINPTTNTDSSAITANTFTPVNATGNGRAARSGDASSTIQNKQPLLKRGISSVSFKIANFAARRKENRQSGSVAHLPGQSSFQLSTVIERPIELHPEQTSFQLPTVAERPEGDDVNANTAAETPDSVSGEKRKTANGNPDAEHITKRSRRGSH